CPRPEVDSTDWCTIAGASYLLLCPQCVDHIKRYHPSPTLRHISPMSYGSQCSLGMSPWVRLAWLLTLKRRLPNLDLLEDMAKMDTAPDHSRQWYGIVNREGSFIRGFYVSAASMRKLDQLLPYMTKLFTPWQSRSLPSSVVCALQNDNGLYLDELVNAHTTLDMTRFSALLKKCLRVRPCSRDVVITDGLWHYVPGVSGLTVCEECYETVIEPWAERGSEVARRFNRTLQPLYGTYGNSCQLYSRRMRDIFWRAAESNNGTLLERKGAERREMETRLQARLREAQRRWTGDKLRRELEWISGEWRRWE
ncbi:hypothetical protein K470DRAFT_219197, partial [Piedraia hortae CBS 480.64]